MTPQRLLEGGRVRLLGQRQHRLAGVEHVVAADLVAAVGKPIGVHVGGRVEQHLGGVRGTGRQHHQVAGEALLVALVVHHHAGDRGTGRVRLQPDHIGVGQHRDVRVLQGGPYPHHLGVGLGVQRTREPVAAGTAHTGAVGHVRLVEQQPVRRVERMVAGRRQIVGELLDTRLVGHRRVRVRATGRRLGRILAARAVHLVELLGPGVVRLHVGVGDRPGRRDAAVVAQFAEVLGPQPVQRRAVEFRGPADEVVHLRLECLATAVVPGVRRDVAVVHEDVGGLPVLRFPGQPVAALQQQDPLARRRQVPGEGTAAGSGTDDDDVVPVRHVLSLRSWLRSVDPGSVPGGQLFGRRRPPTALLVGLHRGRGVE